MRVFVILACVLAVSACGGRRDVRAVTPIAATGPISRACLAADRDAATPALCACVQGVADAQLSSRDRRELVRFFDDPEYAHSVRISDTPADDAFWERYQAFVRSARATCG